MSSTPADQDECRDSDCVCSDTINRRNFLRVIGISTLPLLATQLPVMAGPFEPGEFEKLVPADKKLSTEWVKSLFDRGAPEIYRAAELKWIGMPIGGICAGQVYLGGDGKLWHWDIFNQHTKTGAEHYAKPRAPAAPLQQSFQLQIGDKTRALDATGFTDISFRGEYPIGRVEYRADNVTVTLEAFSPFIPLNTDDSSLPATVMQFTVKNTGAAALEATLSGSLENVIARTAVCVRRNQVISGKDFQFLQCSAESTVAADKPAQTDIVFEDWKQENYAGWKVEGTAFGGGPIKKTDIPSYQGDVGGDTPRVVNSHATAPGKDTLAKDNATGQLTSAEFEIERRFITFWIGGGNHAGKTCLNLLVDGKVVRTATGANDKHMARQSFDVQDLHNRKAVIQIVDAQTGAWGNIGVGKITFTDQASGKSEKLESLPDFGTMGLALLGAPADVTETEKLIGKLGRKLKLQPGKSQTVSFVLAWHFPNLQIEKLPSGRYYATKFSSALAVAKYLTENFERLASHTRLWRDTWYDSTLPYWLLDRAQLNTSILATSTCYRFSSGQFWSWEGVGCCPGTCVHVWHYAQAVARQFPELERILREQTDYGAAMRPDGGIGFRGAGIPAVDAQAGTILRTLREHQMSADDAFLKRVWPAAKRATQWLIDKDGNADGIIESNQHNTLDTDWFGAVAWLSGLYLAALQAAATMADEMHDADFAARCRKILALGQQHLVADLFDGEYFFNKPSPQHVDSINSGSGCEIDQVMGQSWAWQVGLPRVFPQQETKSALRSLWKYNFAPDVGPYRAHYKSGRWYAMAGEAGLLMCSFPRKDWDYTQARGKGKAEWAAGYFNECMNGFEYQVAGHMIWEGLVQEGLAVTRAVHDRYSASRRNPYNEIECGDHYARSMASYGVFLAACGFEYHGPKGHLGFAPRLTPENFKAPFTVAEGWGTFAQRADNAKLTASLALAWGKLRLKSMNLTVANQPTSVTARLGEKPVACAITHAQGVASITFAEALTLSPGASLEIVIE